MERVRRICPQCRAVNPLEADQCVECGAEMVGDLPVLRESRLPVPWKEVGASLALGAATLAVRAGWHLLQALLERRHAHPVSLGRVPSDGDSLAKRPAKRDAVRRTPAAEPRIRMWGRRVSGVRRGDGTSQWQVEEFVWEQQT
jgi:hypothetical protein